MNVISSHTCCLPDVFRSVCAWPWEFTGNTKGVSLPVSARLPPSHTHTHARMHIQSSCLYGELTWLDAESRGCTRNADEVRWVLSLGKRGTREKDSSVPWRQRGRKGGRVREDPSNVIYQSQTLPLPPGECRARVHIPTLSHMWLSFFVQYSITPLEAAAHKQADSSPPSAFSQTFVPTLPQIIHLSRLMRLKISLRLTRETFRVSSTQRFWCKIAANRTLEWDEWQMTEKRQGWRCHIQITKVSWSLKKPQLLVLLITFPLYCKYSSKPPHMYVQMYASTENSSQTMHVC